VKKRREGTKNSSGNPRLVAVIANCETGTNPLLSHAPNQEEAQNAQQSARHDGKPREYHAQSGAVLRSSLPNEEDCRYSCCNRPR